MRGRNGERERTRCVDAEEAHKDDMAPSDRNPFEFFFLNLNPFKRKNGNGCEVRELKARQTLMVVLFWANVSLTFANSTIFSLFPISIGHGVFFFSCSPPFFCRMSMAKKKIY